ncbi:response regulator receiver modulated diguanylate cyclase/phosphodiesterase [Pseudoxanthomonas sp. 3HH-4]|uniref:EAL domain-containing protein n=1 Tax=Pseudoxanthomonas sp. 3HH-4 TaxID=1690214 RepID=UPI001154B0C8|nr:EAL domain-containing response regulator [Pseudoxanthomonas sp. 3HH-4]TQM03677.1 response regulator receiver modulated diguanylate cyclase/phosphodiesterase [Pseudoxanthomonas sp. 3HH-4]
MSAIDSTSRPQDEPSRSRLRAETPPAHYWRRWVDDAAPEDAAEPGAGEPVEMTSQSSIPPEPPATSTPPRAAVAATPAGPPSEPVDPESPYRVLIVEDDRGQALFAQSVLHGAGMQADVQMQSDGLLDAMRRFRPDLVLMDLHMPGRDGMSLTMLLRQQPEYLHLPIVFLTGDPDPERQFEVLESGADDFLNKPIRPRHLIAAVSNRIQRARQRSQAQQAPRPSLNTDTGLPTRTFVLQQLGESLQRQGRGGLFFVEVNSALSLRERYGYAVFEHLMSQAGRQLAAAASPHPVARLNDNSFLMLADSVDEATLAALAQQLRDGLAGHDFETRPNEVLKLRGSIGYTALSLGFADAGSALEAIERAVLQARLKSDSLAEYIPAQVDDDAPRISLEDGQFELAYQPIVAVAGNDQAQYQVLLRMRQPDGSLLPASQVIPAAELAGGISQIDHWVLEHALFVLAERQAAGPSLRLFVSQSPRSLARESHAPWLLDALRARGIEGTSLVIDLRLSDALIHTVTLRQFCQQLMPAGVQFCLSQFEPGVEADALLTQLPLGFVRVSSKYASAHADPVLRDQLRGIIDNAHRQGLQVIGQQIEDPQAAAAMWMGGVDFIQGNLVQAVGSELGFDFHNAVL